MSPDDLIRKWGFISNPFEPCSAEAERRLGDSVRKQLFVEPPYYKDIVGNPVSPLSSIVFGMRGEGKSTICNMVQLELQKNPENKVLLVPYDDFSEFDEAKIQHLSLEDHIKRILQLAVKKFVAECRKDARIMQMLDATAQADLQWFVLRFLPAADYSEAEQRLVDLFDSASEGAGRHGLKGKRFRRIASYLRRKKFEFQSLREPQTMTVQIIKALLTFLAPPVPGEHELWNATMLQLVDKFRNLAVSGGFASVQVFIDKVDENEVYSGNFGLVSDLILPIITSLDYLEVERFATKFFLPAETRQILGNRIRTDRILTRNISWSQEALKTMLRNRLLSFSENKIGSMESFVASAVWKDFENKLLHYAAFSPRNMLRIIAHVVTETCELSRDPTEISPDAIESGIRQFLLIRTSEEDGSEYQKRLAVSSTPS